MYYRERTLEKLFNVYLRSVNSYIIYVYNTIHIYMHYISKANGVSTLFAYNSKEHRQSIPC